MHYILAVITAAILYIFQAFYYKYHWNKNLCVTVSYNKSHAQIGETVILTEQIKNQKRLPIPVLYVKFSTSRTFLFENSDNAAVSDHYHRNDLFSIMGQQQITRTLQFQTSKRGYFSTNSINLVVNDLFMHNSYAEKIDNHTSLYVYPALLNDRYSLTFTSSVIGEISKKDLYEDPLSFRGIRDYTSQDSMRHINWKASAKQQQLMVNTYFDIQSTEVVLLFNLDTNVMQRDTQLQEYMISVTATLLHHISTKGYASKIAINIPDPFTEENPITDFGKGNEHLQSLLQILARLDLSQKLTPFEDFFIGPNSLFGTPNTNTIYLIISNYRKDHLLTLCNEKRLQGHKMQFICPEKAPLCTPIPNIHYWEVMQHEI